jgi:peptidoglycan hydrolase-like protein with peptidoglycan-binding domain
MLLGSLFFALPAFAASEAVRCVQHQLNALGYEAGPADGLFGGKTANASEAYRQDMSEANEGWRQVALTEKNAVFWCEKVAEAHDAAQEFFEAYSAEHHANNELFVLSLEVAPTLTAGEPYDAAFFYEPKDEAGIVVERACFTWNGEGPYCFPLQSVKNTRSALKLKTGNPNTYTLAGWLKYRLGGKIYESNKVQTQIDVKP